MQIDILYQILEWIDFIIYFLFLCSVGYLFIFAVSSLKSHNYILRIIKKQYRFLIVFTADEIDERIHDSINSFLNQTFPKSNFDIAIISKDISESAKKGLLDSPVTLMKCHDNEHFRAEMIESVIKEMESNYDIIVIMKHGNTVDSNFLEEINKSYYAGGMAIQTHRILIDPKTNTGILNAISEEINNSIFRRGHVRLGFSSGLIGSGMAFNYDWFNQNIGKVRKAGLTKELEVLLLKQGVFIQYLEDVFTYDQRAGSLSAFSKQRHSWYTGKRRTRKDAAKDFPKALLAGNFDFCDKIFQWLIPSKFILLFAMCMITLFLIIVEWPLSIKWFILLILLVLVFDLATPAKFRNLRSIGAMMAFPILFLSTLVNTLRIRLR